MRSSESKAMRHCAFALASLLALGLLVSCGSSENANSASKSPENDAGSLSASSLSVKGGGSASYKLGDRATFTGTVRIKRNLDSGNFPGESLWAILELDEPVTILDNGYSKSGEYHQEIFQLDLDFNLDADKDKHELALPRWEPLADQAISVTGTVTVVPTYNIYRIQPYYLEDMVVNSNTGGQTTGIDTTSRSAAGQSSLINLSNPSDYRDINLFLSNFAEWSEFWWHKSYHGANPDKLQVVNWAFWHHALNNGALVREETEVPGATNGFSPGKSYEPGSGSWFGRHTDTAGVERAINRYLGLDYDLTGFNDGYYAESNGNLYESAMRGSALPEGIIALANNATDLGNGEVKVDFSLYTASLDMISDKSWYSLTPEQAKARIEREGNADLWLNDVTGQAVVNVSGTGNDRSLTLVSFTTSAS